MENSLEKVKLRELVLYQAILDRRRAADSSLALLRKPCPHVGRPLNPLEINPGVKRIFEKLQRQIFVHSDWWSAIHPDKGLVIDLLV